MREFCSFRLQSLLSPHFSSDERNWRFSHSYDFSNDFQYENLECDCVREKQTNDYISYNIE